MLPLPSQRRVGPCPQPVGDAGPPVSVTKMEYGALEVNTLGNPARFLDGPELGHATRSSASVYLNLQQPTAASGGVSLWAHPRPDALERVFSLLLEWGINGLECIRPRATPSEVQFLEEHAKHNRLLISGGSDWHGTWQGRLGDFFVRNEEVAALLQAGGM